MKASSRRNRLALNIASPAQRSMRSSRNRAGRSPEKRVSQVSSTSEQPNPPPELAALGKRACPDCGGELEWNAGKQVLACPFCGFVPKEQPTRGEGSGAIVEHDLERTLREV